MNHVETYMGVSKNMGKPTKSSILIGFSIINHPFWGTPIFGNTHILFIYLHPGSFLLPLQTSEPINQQTIQLWDSTSVAVYGELIELLDFETLGHLVQVTFVFFMFGSVCVFLLGGRFFFKKESWGGVQVSMWKIQHRTWNANLIFPMLEVLK